MEKDHLEDTGVDGKIILKLLFEKWNGSMDWIDLAHYSDTWHALLNAAMNFRVPKMRVIAAVVEDLLDSQE